MNETQTITLKTYLKHAAEGTAAKRGSLAVLLLESGGDATLTGYTTKHAERLRRDFKRDGTAVFEDKRKSNRDRVLTKAERDQVVMTLQSKQPRDVIGSCPDEHWSTYWLGRYIETLAGKRYKSKTSHYLLFKEAKLSFHLPGKTYEKADAGKTATWVKQQSDGRSRLMWGLAWPGNGHFLCGRNGADQWHHPAKGLAAQRHISKSFYGFLNLKIGTHHAFITDWQNMYMTVEVLTKLRQTYPTQQLLIVWDNCGWHRGSEVVRWVRRDGHTKLLFFPPYAPELNPQEHVWKAGRKATTHNQHITDIGHVADDFSTYITGRCFSYGLCGLRPHQVAQA